MSTKVSTSMAIQIRVGLFLQAAGLGIMNFHHHGEAHFRTYWDELDNFDSGMCHFGLVRGNKPRFETRGKLFWRRRVQIPRQILGALCLSCAPGSSLRKKWVLSAYGNSAFEHLNEIANALAEEFEVEVLLKLVDSMSYDEASRNDSWDWLMVPRP